MVYGCVWKCCTPPIHGNFDRENDDKPVKDQPHFQANPIGILTGMCPLNIMGWVSPTTWLEYIQHYSMPCCYGGSGT